MSLQIWKASGFTRAGIINALSISLKDDEDYPKEKRKF